MSFGTGTLASLSLIGQIAGGVTSAAGSYYSAKAQQSAMAFNARMAERTAQSVLDQGNREIGRLTLKAGRIKSSQRAAMAANGVDLGTGSAAETLASTDLMKEIDANQIAANATRSAWGYRTESIMQQAKADSISPFGEMAGSLLGSATSVASSWYKFKQAGALTGTIFDF